MVCASLLRRSSSEHCHFCSVKRRSFRAIESDSRLHGAMRNCLPSKRRVEDVRFEMTVLVFGDPYAVTQRDCAFENKERWITVGAIGPSPKKETRTLISPTHRRFLISIGLRK